MAMYFDCPVCGAPETVKVDAMPGDYDVGIWDYPDIVDTECGCIIPADDADRILDSITGKDMEEMQRDQIERMYGL